MPSQSSNAPVSQPMYSPESGPIGPLSQAWIQFFNLLAAAINGGGGGGGGSVGNVTISTSDPGTAAGTQNDLWLNTATDTLWMCTVTGPVAAATWRHINGALTIAGGDPTALATLKNLNDLWLNKSLNPVLWICTATGTPGTWIPINIPVSIGAGAPPFTGTAGFLYYQTSTGSFYLCVAGGFGAIWVSLNDITVAHGGTGRSTLTNHGVLIGSGVSAVNFAGPGTTGQGLVANGAGADPSFQNVTLATAAGRRINGSTAQLSGGVLTVNSGLTGLLAVTATVATGGAPTEYLEVSNFSGGNFDVHSSNPISTSFFSWIAFGT